MINTVTLDSFPILNSDIIGREAETETVLVLPQKGQVKVLNEVGTQIWKLIDGKRNVRDIADIIHTEYEVELIESEADTLDFITELAGRGIVSIPNS